MNDFISKEKALDQLAQSINILEAEHRIRAMRTTSIEKYAKTHNLFICTTDIIEQLRAEIEQYYADCSLSVAEQDDKCKRCTDTTFGSILHIIDKYTKGDAK